MATITIDGCTIHYEVFGSGPPLVLTPGGRNAKAVMRPLARVLADRCQVVIWDRRNTGSSDVHFGGERSEQEVCADDIAELVRQLGIAPSYLGGGSAGCRVSLMAAARHPEVVRGLVLFMASGGPYASQNLGYQYHVPFIHAAQAGGMEAVAETPFFSELIAKNPGNRTRLLALDPKEFIRTMQRWNEAFYYRPEMPLIGCTKDDLRSIRAPTLLFHGNDDHHSREVSDAVSQLLPAVQQAELPWGYEEWIEISNGRVPDATPARELLPRLAGPFADFIARTEAHLQAARAGR